MKDIKFIILTTIICIGILILYPSFIMNIEVVGDSMYPTLKEGQEGYCLKRLYKFNRFDYIVYEHNSKKVIKRLIGFPNETIRYEGYVLYIDDVKYEETYLSEDAKSKTFYISNEYTLKLQNEGIKLNDNEYFALGDNRIVSLDCRSYGPIDSSLIIGKAVKIK